MRSSLALLALLSSLSSCLVQASSNSIPVPVWSRRASARELISADFQLDEDVLQRRDLDYITDLSSTDPIQAAKDVQQIPYLANNASGITDTADQIVQGDSDEAQLYWNADVPFIQSAATNITTASGWEELPQVEGFNLNRSWEVVPGAVMPFYSTANLDPAQIKRAVITWPGKPRDAWKYANLYRNALSIVYQNSTYNVANDSILIISPVWMNELDQQGGAVQGNEIYFHGSEWEAGGNSVGPNLTKSYPGYSVVDNFTDMLFDKAQYPNMNQVVIAGHSMGGQATHRYAVLKKQKTYDDNMSYWVGNPGSWTYLSTDRPYSNASCTTTFDNWHYGIGGNTTKVDKYARADVVANKTAIIQRYLNRKVHMALGLLDNGAGDTHCEARDQGGNHLDRGSQYVLHLASVNNGVFPAAQTVDFIGNTSHQDFAMISANKTLNWIFVNDYSTSYPAIIASNPGDNVTKATHTAKAKAYATHGNIALASGLLGGSVLLIIAVFSMLPFAFRSNFVDEEHEKTALLQQKHQHNFADSTAGTFSTLGGSAFDTKQMNDRSGRR
ncbi:hypothetical protein CBS101457_002223 [Exobasidium rhododendri]|nr:hypothetical protein CBS101457_002223 [Exobasidium rhododendri]